MHGVGISSVQLLCIEGSDLRDQLYTVVRDQARVKGVQFFGQTSDGVAWLISITSYVLRIAVGTVQAIADRRELPVIVVLSPREMMYRMRASIQYPLEREHIDIVMDANRPKTSQKPMQENDINRNRHEVATGEDRHRLDEGIQRVEGKSSERSHCFGLVMDEMQVSVYFGVVEQPMEPVGQKLIVKDMDEQIQRQERGDVEGVLHLREVRISNFDQVDQRRLAEDVQGRPLQIMQIALLLKLQLLLARGELPFEQHVEDQVGETTQGEVEGHCEYQGHSAAREVFVEDRPFRSQGLPISDQHPRVAEMRPGCGQSFLEFHYYQLKIITQLPSGIIPGVDLGGIEEQGVAVEDEELRGVTGRACGPA